MHTNDRDKGNENLRAESAYIQHSHERNPEHPGFEVQDVNVNGLLTFLVGLAGFFLIFFIFCFVMGKAINTGIAREDGPRDKWHQQPTMPVQGTSHGIVNRLDTMTSNPTMEQRQYAALTKLFPTPRLQTDDGNQDTADMHAREDLLLGFYSTGDGLPPGKVRIPIDAAMALIVQQGLPQPAGGMQIPGTEMAGDSHPSVTQPLTNGFARTGYEQDQIVAREQRVEFNQAEGTP